MWAFAVHLNSVEVLSFLSPIQFNARAGTEDATNHLHADIAVLS